MSTIRSTIHLDQVFFALAVILFGTVALLENLEVHPEYDFWKFWPAALILLGLGDLFKKPYGKHAFGGMLFVGVGAFWLAENLLSGFDVSLWQLWPLILIGFGVKLLLHKKSDYPTGTPRLADHKTI
ncbi:MAG: hypothetical protein JXQ27_16420 [Acidobacteria bacterium]|nr:hypothetical protein [Acidobacteriota bacterium]